MQNNSVNRVFVDTNVLINDFLFRIKKNKSAEFDYKALLFLERKNAEMYIASFSIVQFVSTCQRAKIKDDLIIVEIKKIMGRYNIIDFTKEDIEKSFNQLEQQDIEDVWQYTLSQKLRCRHILTANTKDFKSFANIELHKPKDIQTISLKNIDK